MKKRLLGLLLGVMLISVCVGCGAESTTTEPTETTTAESTTEQTEEATATPEETTAPTPEATTEPSEEATEEPSEETTAETEPETTEPAETAEPEQTETPTTEPVPQYTYTDMSATMYAQQTVNVRDLPDTSGNKLGSLSTNDEITISGQCNETSWYRFEYNGIVAYVSNKYVGGNKVEVQQAPPAQETAQETSNVPNPYELPAQTWIDLGDWFLYIQPSLDCPDNVVNSPFWEDKKTILLERYPNKQCPGRGGIALDNGTWSAWHVSVYDGISADGTHGVGYPQSLIDFIAKYQYHY